MRDGQVLNISETRIFVLLFALAMCLFAIAIEEYLRSPAAVHEDIRSDVFDENQGAVLRTFEGNSMGTVEVLEYLSKESSTVSLRCLRTANFIETCVKCTITPGTQKCMSVHDYFKFAYSIVATLFLGLLNEQFKQISPLPAPTWRSWWSCEPEPILTKDMHGLLFGLGGGFIGSFLMNNFPHLKLDVAEIHSVIARDVPFYMGFPKDDPRVRLEVQEGAEFLAVAAEENIRYDFAMIDICTASSTDGCGTYREDHSGCCPPGSMMTETFFNNLKSVLHRGDNVSGVLIAHIWTHPQHRLALVEATLRHHFQRVLCFGGTYSGGWSSVVFLAWDGPDYSAEQVVDLNDQLDILSHADKMHRREVALMKTKPEQKHDRH